jgi:uncharacterized protein involved in exopolysaccharide biosynthesis
LTVDFARHVAILRSSLPIMVVAVVVAVAAALGVSAQLPRVYEARAVLYVGESLSDANLGYDSILASQVLARTYAQFATTGPLLAAVVDKLDLDMRPEALGQQVSAETQPESTLLTIIGRANDPDFAALIANAVAEELQESAPAGTSGSIAAAMERIGELDREIASIEQRLVDLVAIDRTPEQDAELLVADQELAALTRARARLAQNLPSESPNSLTLVDPAVAPDAASAPSQRVIVAAVAFAAIGLSVTAAYVRAGRRGLLNASPPEADPGAPSWVGPGGPDLPTDPTAIGGRRLAVRGSSRR